MISAISTLTVQAAVLFSLVIKAFSANGQVSVAFGIDNRKTSISLLCGCVRSTGITGKLLNWYFVILLPERDDTLTFLGSC